MTTLVNLSSLFLCLWFIFLSFWMAYIPPIDILSSTMSGSWLLVAMIFLYDFLNANLE